GFLFVLIVGLVAGTISGIVGTGSSIMLMPVLVYQYGPKQAVPIMAIAALLAHVSPVLASWRRGDWRARLAHSVAGPPAGARRAHGAGAAFAHRRYRHRHFLDRDGAGASLARAPRAESQSLASRNRRRRHRLSHRHRGVDRAAECATVPVLRTLQRRVPRH